jgi:phosphatidylserine/phosphatidylglycerophosphate/cardiolipin synthase-like enzyme
MANKGVSGKIYFTDTTTRVNLPLIIKVFDADGIVGSWGEDELGTQEISNGEYKIEYDPKKYGLLELKPDLLIRIFDNYFRLVYETKVYDDVTDEIKSIDDIFLVKEDISGLYVTNAMIPAENGSKKGDPVNISSGNKVDILIDNENTWPTLFDSIKNSQTSVDLTQLMVEPDSLIAKFTNQPSNGNAGTGENLCSELKTKAGNGIKVRFILNDFADIDFFGRTDSKSEAEDYFKNSSVELKFFETSLYFPMHAKIVVIDKNEAWVLGSPFMQIFYDNNTHNIINPKRGVTETVTNSKAIRWVRVGITFPIHDVSIKLKGPAVGYIDKSFQVIYDSINNTTSSNPVSTPSQVSDANNVKIQIVRTLPGGRNSLHKYGETGILEGYQRAIANAKDYVYIEDQYIWCADLFETLKRAIKLNTSLQVIIIADIKLDIPGYESKQNKALKDFLKFSENEGASDRVGVFTLWLHENGNDEKGNAVNRIIPLYVHSKVGLVDDIWATIGSANLDGGSLNTGWVAVETEKCKDNPPHIQHASSSRSGQPGRNVEVNVIIHQETTISSISSDKIIEKFRQALWIEHLQLDSFPTKQSGDWLKLWKDKADNKLNDLKTNPTTINKCRALKWVPSNKPKCYFKALGIKTKAFQLMDYYHSFDLKTGKWID